LRFRSSASISSRCPLATPATPSPSPCTNPPSHSCPPRIQPHLPNIRRHHRPPGRKTYLHPPRHSLGGANAVLFSALYTFQYPPVLVYETTFLSPRGGNRSYKIFAGQLRNLSLLRLVNRRDNVPRVPVRSFAHAGNLVWRRPATHADLGGDRDQWLRAYYRQIGKGGYQIFRFRGSDR